jgi:hypothetical protein
MKTFTIFSTSYADKNFSGDERLKESRMINLDSIFFFFFFFERVYFLVNKI